MYNFNLLPAMKKVMYVQNVDGIVCFDVLPSRESRFLSRYCCSHVGLKMVELLMDIFAGT
jgi:hypothetical protein